MYRKNSSTWKYIGLMIMLGIIAVAGWWFFSPAFIDTRVNEPFPTTVAEASPTPVVETSQSVTQPAEIQSQPATEAVASAAAEQLLMMGSFYNLSYKGSGEVVVYQLADNSRILRLQDFSVDNGPDLYVYLVPVDPVPATSGTEIAGYYNLGSLKGNVGDQNYEIPSELDLSQFKSVVIWCEAFAVPFAAAPLAIQQ
jgi:hypothetical protein